MRRVLARWRLTHPAVLAMAACILFAAPASTTGASSLPRPGGGPAGESAAGGAFAAAALATTGAAQATRVRLGELGILSGSGYYLAIENGYFAEQGIEVEATRFNNTAEMTAPLAAGQLDVGTGATSAGLFNAMGRGLDLRIVADHGYSAPGRPVNALVVRRDLVDGGEFRSAADLRNRRLGIPSTTVGAMTDVRAYVADGGLSLSDVRVDEVPFPDMLPAIANRSIDAAVAVEPFLTLLVQRGLGVVSRWDYEVNPDHQVAVVLYGPAFGREQPDVARRWMVAYLRGVRYFNDAFVRGDAAARERTIDALTKWTIMTDRALYDSITVMALDPDGGVRLPSLRADQEFFVQQGYQDRPIDLDAIVDLQYVQYARQMLGPY
jgi:NitT/TauT family transport system substrate-binding protein